MTAGYSETVVIGAGPAGLTAGYLLARAGHEVSVIEGDPGAVGGLSRTVEHGGYRIDLGGHPFVSQSEAIVDLWEEMLPEGFAVQAVRTGIADAGGYRSRAAEAGRPRLRDRLGRTITAILPGALAPKAAAELLRYPRLGPGALWEEAARKMGGFGGRLLAGRRLAGLALDGSGLWTVTARRPDGDTETIRARNVVSSATVGDTMDALQPAPLSLFQARSLRHAAHVTVALVARTRIDCEDHWIDVRDPALNVRRVLNYRSWSPEMLPDQFHSCLGFTYACGEGDALWRLSDAGLVALAGGELERLGLSSRAHVVDACVVRQAKAVPLPGDEDALAAIRLDLGQSYPGLQLVGRNGLHRACDQDAAMRTAILAAANIAAGRPVHDVWRVTETAAEGEAELAAALASLNVAQAGAARRFG